MSWLCPGFELCSQESAAVTSHPIRAAAKDQDLFDEVQARMNEPAFGDRAAERMWKSEGLFAEAKVNHCLAQAKYRGRSKVQIHA